MNLLSLQQLLMRIAAVAVVAAVHGLVQALLAERLGDRGPRYDGRRSFNPFKHLDAVGSLACVLFGIGWIRPVVIDPDELRRGRGDLLLIAAGSLAASLALALLARLIRPLLVTILPGDPSGILVFINTLIAMSLWLVAVNSVPLPPLTAFLPLRPQLPPGPLVARRIEIAVGLVLFAATWMGWTRAVLARYYDALTRLIGFG